MDMPRSFRGLIVFGIKAGIAVIVGTLTMVAIIYAFYGIGLLVNLVGKYFGWW